jgi:ATP-binding cassette subfamily B protein
MIKTVIMSIRRIFYYYWIHARHHKVSMFVVLFFYAIAITLSDVVMPWVYREIVDVISSTTTPQDSADQIMHIFSILVAVIASYTFIYRIADYAIMHFESNVIRRLAAFSLDRVLPHSYDFFANQFGGALVAKTKRFVGGIERLFDVMIFNFWWFAVKMPAIIIALTIASPRIALILSIWTVIYVVIVVLFVRYGMRYDRILAAKDSVVTGHFADAVTNALTIKMFASSRRERTHFRKIVDDEYIARRRAWHFELTQMTVQAILLSLLQIIGMYTIITMWLAGEVSAGTVVLVQVYLASIFSTVWMLSKGIKHFVRSLTDAQEMVEIFDAPITVADPDASQVCRIQNGAIVFDHVDFAYEQGDTSGVLTNFNLTIPAGQKVGLVGPSGSGKSTIAKLLLRFADVSNGAITIDDQNITEITQDDLRAKIAYVPQDPLLFHRSIYDNIAYARPEATHDEVMNAARKARAHEFITQLPQGYDTLVGERGVKLSGGQRQRVAIARAILKNAPILVLDEATSALDSESEKHIQDALAELMYNKTTIVIAHRLSTIKKLDRIIVLDDGIVTEDGLHDELVARDGMYSNLWQHQSGGFIE